MNEKDKIITKFGNAKIGKYGYYVIRSGKEGNHGKLLHRLIWEDWYGKPVPDGYDIHHINGNKLDNRIQNLQCVEHSKHVRFHTQNMSDETKRKMSEAHKGKFVGENNPRAKYTLWDITSVHYNKGTMFRDNPKVNPRKCFYYKYDGHVVPIGGFHDFVSVEIINDLVNDAIGE